MCVVYVIHPQSLVLFLVSPTAWLWTLDFLLVSCFKCKVWFAFCRKKSKQFCFLCVTSVYNSLYCAKWCWCLSYSYARQLVGIVSLKHPPIDKCHSMAFRLLCGMPWVKLWLLSPYFLGSYMYLYLCYTHSGGSVGNACFIAREVMYLLARLHQRSSQIIPSLFECFHYLLKSHICNSIKKSYHQRTTCQSECFLAFRSQCEDVCWAQFKKESHSVYQTYDFLRG